MFWCVFQCKKKFELDKEGKTMKQKLIRCKKCDKIFKMTSHDKSPEYKYDEDNDELIEIMKNDRKQFLQEHKGHPKEELTIIKDSYVSEYSYGEPIRVHYIEATNGRERFVIKVWRKKIDASLNYEVVQGLIVRSIVRLKVQEEEIKKQMLADIKSPTLTIKKIENFIKIVEDVIIQVEPTALEEVYWAMEDPMLSCAKLDEGSIGKILEKSGKIFSKKELEKVKEFICQNNDYRDPMTIVVRRKFEIKRIGKESQIHRTKRRVCVA